MTDRNLPLHVRRSAQTRFLNFIFVDQPADQGEIEEIEAGLIMALNAKEVRVRKQALKYLANRYLGTAFPELDELRIDADIHIIER